MPVLKNKIVVSKVLSEKDCIDNYITGFPDPVQGLLKKIRTTIRNAAPHAVETIGYGIPTFKLNGNLVHFAGHKNHIGFYPGPSAIRAFEKELMAYKRAKGSVQFPHEKPIPLALVTKVVKYRVKENLDRKKNNAPPVQKKCAHGHLFIKNTDCPVCPLCEKELTPATSFLSLLAAPARRALQNAGITSIEKLSYYSEQELLQLHGIGKTTLPILKQALIEKGLRLKP